VTALVIGASGHLGAHLVRLLQREGHRVRALVRPSSDLRGLAGLDAEVIRGDVLDGGGVTAAMRGCDEVYHLAAPTGREPDTGRIVVDGTRNVLGACLRTTPGRLVYTSSIVTVGYASDPTAVLDERASRRSDATPYHGAKWLAERLVLEFASREALPVVVVNPATVVGPLDYRVTPSNAPIQRCLDRGLRWAVPGGVTVVHAEDVARGHLRAMREGRPGERYILGGDRLTVRDYFALIADRCGRPRPRATLPRWAVLAGAGVLGVAGRLARRRMPVTFTQAWHLVGRYGWYSSEKARRELGYQWRPAGEAVAGYVDWVRAGRPATAASPEP
jgi:dihydroflavonol-4-reductase